MKKWKKSGYYVYLIVIFVFLFAWKSLFTDTDISSSGYSATMNANLSGMYIVQVDNGIAERKIRGTGRYKDMSFSPSGRYLLIESIQNQKDILVICDAEKILPEDYFANSDDITALTEWIFRGNDMLEIENDDTVSLEFIRWHDTEDYMNFNYAVTTRSGEIKTGEALIDYTAKTVVLITADS